MTSGHLGRRTATALTTLTALLATGLAAAPAQAAGDLAPSQAADGDLVVTTLADHGTGSLRERLLQAAATPDDDRITFASPIRGEILLESQLEVQVGGTSGGLVIEGPGADALTIRPASFPGIRNLRVQGSGDESSSLEISGVRVSDGFARDEVGGGIRSTGADVVLRDATVDANTASRGGGGLHVAGGRLTVVDSTISDNDTGMGYLEDGEQVLYGAGGGIHAEDLELIGSRVTGNHALLRGGGIAIEGATEASAGSIVRHSTIDDNSARDEGGGLFVGNQGGEPVQVSASTIAGNRTDDQGGGIHLELGGEMVLRSTTVTDNESFLGGGLLSDGGVEMHDSVLAMNRGADLAGSGTALLRTSLLQVDRDHAVDADEASLRGVDPLLGELQDHGGPTPTLLPAPNSPVIDAGSSQEATDQRGAPRTVGEAPDMGAVEVGLDERTGLPAIGSVAAPLISGDVRVGEVITTDGGQWSEPSVTLTYQWLADGQPIHRWATEPSFNVGRVFISDRLSVRVTASAPGFQSSTRTSDLTDYPLPGTWTVREPSRVKGTTRVGVELRAARARLAPQGSAMQIEWFVGQQKVERARNSRRFHLRPWMRGKRVKAVFTYSNNGWDPLRQVVRKPRPVR